jgi:hypothetical protein
MHISMLNMSIVGKGILNVPSYTLHMNIIGIHTKYTLYYIPKPNNI